MFTKRRLIMFSCVLVVAAIAGFFAYKQARATTCMPMSGQDWPVDPQLVAGNTQFAFKLLQTLAKDKSSNIVYSPYSISEMLAMLDLGADGQTAAQIEKAMNFSLPAAQLHAAFQVLDNDLVNNAQDPEGTWCRANALWIEKTYALNPTYVDQLKKLYGIDVQSADFKSNPKAATDAINQWAQKQTKDRIQDLFPTATSDTVVALVNAVYFKNAWEIPFKSTLTRPDTFNLVDGTQTTVSMMNAEKYEKFGYAKTSQYQILELPYKGKHVSMVLLMPEVGQFDAVETAFDGEQFKQAVTSLYQVNVQVSLPRFEVQYKLPLLTSLQSLGIIDAFQPGVANFAKMAGSPDDMLYVSQAVHKAFISVNEEGAEAAAASGVFMELVSAPPTLTVKIDHPFLFAIRDQETGSILFMGRIMNPALAGT